MSTFLVRRLDADGLSLLSEFLQVSTVTKYHFPVICMINFKRCISQVSINIKTTRLHLHLFLLLCAIDVSDQSPPSCLVLCLFTQQSLLSLVILDVVKMVCFYIAQYPVRWTAQSASHLLPSLTDLFIPTPTRLLREAF